MKELLTLDEAATFLTISRKSAQHMVDRGQMPGVIRVGRRVRIRAVDLYDSVGLLSSKSARAAG